MIIKIFELLLLAIIFLVLCTEFFYPLIANKPFFGSFRKKKPEVGLNEKVNQAKKKIDEVKEVQNEVNEFQKTAAELKKDADNLLKN